MTKKEFISLQESRAGILRKRGIIYIIIFAVLYIGTFWLIRVIGRHDISERTAKLLALALGVGLLGSMLLCAWGVRRERKTNGLYCKHCGKLIADGNAGIAIASGHCYRCGEKVFDEPKC